MEHQQVFLPLSVFISLSLRNAKFYRTAEQENSGFRSGCPTCGSVKAGWGDSTWRDQLQRACHVAGVSQPPLWHYQKPVWPGEDSRWKLRLGQTQCLAWVFNKALSAHPYKERHYIEWQPRLPRLTLPPPCFTGYFRLSTFVQPTFKHDYHFSKLFRVWTIF